MSDPLFMSRALTRRYGSKQTRRGLEISEDYKLHSTNFYRDLHSKSDEAEGVKPKTGCTRMFAMFLEVSLDLNVSSGQSPSHIRFGLALASITVDIGKRPLRLGPMLAVKFYIHPFMPFSRSP